MQHDKDAHCQQHEASRPGVKRLECEDDHSPPSSADVKNELSYASTPQYVFILLCLC
jgi:hypothetical protein